MGARHKLNRAVLNGCALVAGLLGWLTESWVVFVIALVVAVILALQSGDIRTKPDKRN